VILEILAWCVAADLAGAIMIAGLVFFSSRRSRNPVPIRSTVALIVFLILPAVLLFLLVWAFIRCAGA
jgi:hypothetical protein